MSDAVGTLSMREEVLQGLSGARKELSPKYFYDERGSELFEEITRLPEYYLTRAEEELLVRWVPGWIAELAPRTLVELGAGSSRKTRVALDALRDGGGGGLFVPVDVSEEFLMRVAQELRADYPSLEIRPQARDMTSSLVLQGDLPRPALFLLLGSTLGNFYPEQAETLLRRIRGEMVDGDRLLLGIDLRPGPGKSVDDLEAAYNDSRGVTAEFNRNILHVLNRRLRTNFRPDAFEHRARYNPEHGRMEIGLVALEDQQVRVPDGGTISVAEGEEIRTEISSKYDRSTIEGFLERAGFRLETWQPDEAERFALVLAETDGEWLEA